MRGASDQAIPEKHLMPSQTVEFRGHLIDSLTLSKLADRIEQLSGSYELNDIRIGVHRQDISEINMTVFADTSEQLQAILDDLKPYGAILSGQNSAELAECPEAGTLPEDAFTIRLPQRVLLNGNWVNLNDGEAFALAVEPDLKTARLCRVADLRKGQLVVIGNHGVAW
jgi:hypothetical protein